MAAVIVNAFYKGKWHYGATWDENSRIITDVLEGLEPEILDPVYSPGEDAWFMISDRRHNDTDRVAGNYLRVGVNVATGYGGLIWCLDRADPEEDAIRGHVWVSDNPNPPDHDPRVVADPGYPLFHEPRSVFPVVQVRSALEEYCRVGTGDRPECINWARGELNGRRLDSEREFDWAQLDEDPFA
jgi:hypothetical protein